MYLFSPSTTQAFHDMLHAGQIPADAVNITDAEFRTLLDARAAGQEIYAGPDGKPLARPPAKPSPAEQAGLLHASKVTEINSACEATIIGGFWSSALGAAHQYSSQLDDQLNLTGSVLRGADMPYACRDQQGLKAFRVHTVAQLRQVGDDFTLFKLQLLQYANELKQQLDQALTAGDVDALERVTWEAPQP
jgi:hypothetical protein